MTEKKKKKTGRETGRLEDSRHELQKMPELQFNAYERQLTEKIIEKKSRFFINSHKSCESKLIKQKKKNCAGYRGGFVTFGQSQAS